MGALGAVRPWAIHRQCAVQASPLAVTLAARRHDAAPVLPATAAIAAAATLVFRGATADSAAAAAAVAAASAHRPAVRVGRRADECTRGRRRLDSALPPAPSAVRNPVHAR